MFSAVCLKKILSLICHFLLTNACVPFVCPPKRRPPVHGSCLHSMNNACYVHVCAMGCWLHLNLIYSYFIKALKLHIVMGWIVPRWGQGAIRGWWSMTSQTTIVLLFNFMQIGGWTWGSHSYRLHLHSSVCEFLRILTSKVKHLFTFTHNGWTHLQAAFQNDQTSNVHFPPERNFLFCSDSLHHPPTADGVVRRHAPLSHARSPWRKCRRAYCTWTLDEYINTGRAAR